MLGQLRLPGRAAVRVRQRARRRGRVAADRGVARRDGRRLGAVRGVGADPVRRRRLGAGLRVREVVAGRSARCDDAAARSVLRGAAVAGQHQRRGAAGARAARRRPLQRARLWPRSRRAAAAMRERTRPRSSPATPTPATLLAEPYIVSPLRKHDCPPISDGAAAIVLAAGDLARRVSERPAWISGIDHRIEPPRLGVRDLTQSPSTKLAGERAGASRRARRRRRAARAVHAPGADPARRARPRRGRTHQSVGRRAGGERRDGRRARAHRRGGAAHHRRHARTARSPTRRPGRACNRTSSASWRRGMTPLLCWRVSRTGHRPPPSLRRQRGAPLHGVR